MNGRVFTTLAAGLFALTLVAPARAGVIFLDYSDFDARLGELATAAGITPFSGGEVTSISSGIKTDLESIYSDFTGLSFVDSAPGGTFATINFGLTGGGLGVADHIDFLNTDLSDVARVFSANFGFIVDEFSGSTDRADQISQLTTALTGTAAHELGHNLGLRHHDAHGDLVFDGTPIVTGGDENTHIMATGSTGLTELGRESVRDFSTNSIVKLEYAAGTLPVNPTDIAEGVDAGGTAGTAKAVALESLPVSGRLGEVVTGTIGATGDTDFFRIDGSQVGSSITADINNDFASGVLFNSVDTVLTIFASDGVTELGSVDDTFYSTTTFGSGDFRDFDGVLYNVATNPGEDVYVRVNGFGTDTGDYRLLIHTDGSINVVPEPASLAIMAGIGMVVVCRRRRRKPVA